MDWGTGVTSLGTTALRERNVTFGIKDDDRLRHMAVLGRPGSGRGEFIARMALQDIERGLSVVILDAKGNVAPYLMERFDASIADRLIYVDPAEAEYPYAWNLLSDIRSLPEKRRVETLVKVIESVYQVAPNPFASMLAEKLLAKDDATLVSFYRLLFEETFRKEFFKDDETGLTDLDALLLAHPDTALEIEEKGRYIAKDTLVRNLLGQPRSKFSLADMVRAKSIVVVNLEKIRMFPTRMTPIIRTFIEAALMAGADSRVPPALYLHDAVRYLGDREVERVFDCRHVALTVADTVIQESDRERREAALVRCGSIAAFAAHPFDRQLVERAFYPYIEPEEVEALEAGELVIALTIDAVRTQPFFGKALPMGRGTSNSYQDLVTQSRARYTTSRREADEIFKGKDEGGGRPKKPGGFQDAFKSMFEKRAGAAQNFVGGPKPDGAKTSTQGGQEKAAADEAPSAKVKEGAAAQSIPKQETSTEIAEDILKQMLYVPAV